MTARVDGTKVLEYFTIYAIWKFHEEFAPNSRENYYYLNFEKNMEDFEACVNSYLEEGWQPLGAPSFSKEWMIGLRGGKAIQAVVREKNVVKAGVVAVAENVTSVRRSTRISSNGK
jgi:hypothetical protein